MKHLFLLAVLPVVLMGWTSCSHSGKGHPALPDPRAVDKSVPEYKNPFHPSTYAHLRQIRRTAGGRCGADGSRLSRHAA